MALQFQKAFMDLGEMMSFTVMAEMIISMGGSGNDELHGGDINGLIDRIYGGDDNDTIHGYRGFNYLYGNDGSDYIYGGDSGNDIDGGEGNDFLYGGSWDDTIRGGSGNDYIVGGAGYDVIDGGAGWDTASYVTSNIGLVIDLRNMLQSTGDAYADTIISIDEIRGTDHGDTIHGYDDVSDGDYLVGLGGHDYLYGYQGNDYLRGGQGDDYLDGGAGIDKVSYYTSTTHIHIELDPNADGDSSDGYSSSADAGDDDIRSIEIVHATNYNDTIVGLNSTTQNDILLQGYAGDDYIFGRAGDDVLQGDGGNDTLVGGDGADTLDGGADRDRATYEESPVGVEIHLADTSLSTGYAKDDTYINIEEIHGSDEGDTIYGSASNEYLVGRNGEDSLYGYGGNDYLRGEVGADYLDGGSGRDKLSYYNSKSGGNPDAVNVDLDPNNDADYDGTYVIYGTGVGGHAEGDTLISFEIVYGSDGNDTIEGTAIDEFLLQGYKGNDLIVGQQGSEELIGDSGNDTLHGDEYIGDNDDSEFVDLIFDQDRKDSHGDDTLKGGDGNDFLYGGYGADRIIGGLGKDVMSAIVNKPTAVNGSFEDSSSLDTFVFESLADTNTQNPDEIHYFTDGLDVIDLSAISEIEEGDLVLTELGQASGLATTQIKDANSNFGFHMIRSDQDGYYDLQDLDIIYAS